MKTKFFAVVHAEDHRQVLRNVERAVEAGADGVFLINHSVSARRLLHYVEHVDRRFPRFWVGVNRLGQHWSEYFNDLPPCVKGVWADESHVHLELHDQTPGAMIYARRSQWTGELYFGGVAFKTQAPLSDEGAAVEAQFAMKAVQVITTSGPATGKAPTTSKIKAMREAIGDHPLAIASGITPENVQGFLPYVDYLLVATGVSDSFSELSLSRMKDLVNVLGYNQSEQT